MEPLGDLLRNQSSHTSKKTTPTPSTEDHADNAEVCPICYGFGWVTRDVPVDHPDFGKAFPCECRQLEMDQSRFDRLLKISNLGIYRTKTFETFEYDMPELSDDNNRFLTVAFQLARHYAEEPDAQMHPWILFQGGYGAGKTHLAAAIGNYLLDRNHRVIFLTAPDLLDHLRNTYSRSSEVTYDDMFEQIRDVQVLIIDDLGSESPTAWATEKLYQLFNHRYVNRLPTVITTNQEIEQIDGRIASRLKDVNFCRLVKMHFPDYRSKEIQENSDLSNLRLYSGMHFENFHIPSQLPPDVRKKITLVRNEAYHFSEKPDGWFVLMGKRGCGKTHLAAAIANACSKNQIEVIWMNTGELADRLRETFSSDSRTSFSARFQEIRQAKLLILDDFRMIGRQGDWAMERLFQLVDYRYLAKLPTVFTKFGDSFEDLPVEFQSRFSDPLCKVLHITAPDYRHMQGKTGVRVNSKRS